MSRTDHHRTWQLRAADPAERARTRSNIYYHHMHWGQSTHENCEWTMPWVSLSTTPRWFRRHYWYGPERGRERISLRAMAHEYNTFGDLDDGDFACPQHRHCAAWAWS